MFKCPTSDSFHQHRSLDLEGVELYVKGFWDQMDTFGKKDWNCCNALVVDDQKQDLQSDTILYGTDMYHKLHIFSADMSGYEGKASLTIKPLVPGERATKQQLDQKFHHASHPEQLSSRDELIFSAETKGKRCIFGLKLIDSKCETKNGATGISIKGLTNHMKKILSSGNFADMALIVGQNKTRIQMHKNIMVQSPWIERYLKNLYIFFLNYQLFLTLGASTARQLLRQTRFQKLISLNANQKRLA